MKNRQLLQLACVVLWASTLLPSSASAQVEWDGDAQLRSFGATTTTGAAAGGNLGLTPLGGGSGTEPQNLEDGFQWTNVRITYESVAADVGRDVFIDWNLVRAFSAPAGDYTVTGSASGSVTLPTSASAFTRFSLFASEGMAPVSDASETFRGPDTFSIGSSKVVTLEEGSGLLDMVGSFNLKPTAAGQLFTLDFPDSAVARLVAAPVPEPSLAVMLGLGLIGLALTRKPSSS